MIVNIILTVIKQHQPGLVVMSIGDVNVKLPAIFAHFTAILSGLAQGKMIVVAGACHKSAEAALSVLLGDPCPDIGSVHEPCQRYALFNLFSSLNHLNLKLF